MIPSSTSFAIVRIASQGSYQQHLIIGSWSLEDAKGYVDRFILQSSMQRLSSLSLYWESIFPIARERGRKSITRYDGLAHKHCNLFHTRIQWAPHIKLLWIGLRSVASRLLSKICICRHQLVNSIYAGYAHDLRFCPLTTSGYILAKGHVLGWCLGLWWPLLLQLSDIIESLLLLPDSKRKGTRIHT